MSQTEIPTNVQDNKQEFEKMKEYIHHMEEENTALRDSVARYCNNWLNKCWRADAGRGCKMDNLEDEVIGLSQASWLASLSSRSYDS